MQRILVYVLISAVAFGVIRCYPRIGDLITGRSSHSGRPLAATSELPSGSDFTCDGRTRCSQLTSCAEASYFLQHCPGTTMDREHGGIPCERQWCSGP